MASNLQPENSFSLRRKWSIAVDLTVRTIVVLAVLVMANYLASHYFQRFFLSSQTRVELSPRTINLLKTVTNDVKVTLYYDKEDALYSSISQLLNEYKAINPRVSVVTVDYLRDAAEAQRVSTAYKLNLPQNRAEKNLVIFDCDGRWKIVPGDALAERTLEEVPDEKERKFRAKIVAFKGEMIFTTMLLGVSNPNPLKACFLQNHGEHSLDSSDDVIGYMRFAAVLKQNYIEPQPISLLGTNGIPADCNLLVIAGPTTAITEGELEKIEQYLTEGGRLLVLFNPMERVHQTGLEKILERWGVITGEGPVQDPDQTERGSDIVVSAFSRHPIVNPLLGSAVQLILPRPLQAAKSDKRKADAPVVEEVAFTGERAFLSGNPQKTRRYAVVVVVEKGAVRGVVTERGATRILVVGDSMMFGNGMIEKWANRDFAGYAVNWLLDRSLLLEGLGPRPVTEFRINMTRSQLQVVQWILLAAIPGGVLALGMLVWLGRRK